MKIEELIAFDAAHLKPTPDEKRRVHLLRQFLTAEQMNAPAQIAYLLQCIQNRQQEEIPHRYPLLFGVVTASLFVSWYQLFRSSQTGNASLYREVLIVTFIILTIWLIIFGWRIVAAKQQKYQRLIFTLTDILP